MGRCQKEDRGSQKMTPAKRAKELGAKSLNQVAQKFGCTVQNLSFKFKTNRNQFEIIVVGVVELSKGQ